MSYSSNGVLNSVGMSNLPYDCLCPVKPTPGQLLHSVKNKYIFVCHENNTNIYIIRIDNSCTQVATDMEPQCLIYLIYGHHFQRHIISIQLALKY